MPSNTEEAPVYIDRRGANKIWVPEKVEPLVVDEKTGAVKGEWEDVAYMVVMIQMQRNQPPMVAGRAVGLRKHDQKTCIADYLFSPIWPSQLDWVKDARKRLDTFLDCDCGANAPCSLHQMNMPLWQKSDMERLNMIASMPLPKALEALMRMEMAKAQSKPNIVIPGN
jgi:hypothetical protein